MPLSSPFNWFIVLSLSTYMHLITIALEYVLMSDKTCFVSPNFILSC